MATSAPARPARPRQFISVHDAAARLGVEVRTVRRYIHGGKLPAFRVGDKLLRVDAADVDALARPVDPYEVSP